MNDASFIQCKHTDKSAAQSLKLGKNPSSKAIEKIQKQAGQRCGKIIRCVYYC
jgi:hypothetical protein